MLIQKIKKWMPPYLWPVLILPYVMAAIMVLVHVSVVFWGSIPAYVLMGLGGLYALIALGFSIYAVMRKTTAALAAVRTAVLKCAQIPAYVFFFCVGVFGTLLGIWGVGFVVFAYLCDVFTIALTGLYAARCARQMVVEGILTKKQGVFLAVASFIFCVDVPVSLYFLLKSAPETGFAQRIIRYLNK